jgi:uncharacterized protein YpbB
VVGGMRYIEYIILYCLKKLNGERTIYSIYHLLKGKKSSQTIQDAHLFELIKFFRIYEPLTREILEDFINKALKNQWIISCSNQRFLLTNTGVEVLNKNLEKLETSHINGWKYNASIKSFWERLSLLIQVVSNLAFQKTKYIPIQKNRQVHNWIKVFLKNTQIDRNLLGKTIFLELVDCLQSAKDIDPSVLIFRLTGHNRIGLTSIQAAEKLEMEYSEYIIEFQNVLHYLIRNVNSNRNDYPLISSLLNDLREESVLTNSSKATYNLVQEGYTINEIAVKRHLKTSTIEDHIVEIALNIDGFSIDSFINPGNQNKILSVARSEATKQLKLIKNKVVSANYFEIRLVLAKYGVKQWN